jgi:RNA polymerase sigma-70 factor (ECF subfamily)
LRFQVNHRVSETEIVEGCLAGKKYYQDLLYHKYASKMFGVCFRYSQDKYKAEDILQESFIKVFQSLDRFRKEGSLEGWIRRIVVNTSLEEHRKNVHMYPVSDFEEAVLEYSEEEVLSGIAADELMSMLDQLSPGYRTIFNLYAIEGYSHKEIAEMLGISEGTSKSQLARARMLLKEMIVLRMAEGNEQYAGK